MNAPALAVVRGRLTENAPLSPLVWFKAGGPARWLFEPADVDDLSDFLAALDPSVDVMGLGLGSNLIVRDGGFPGVVVRLGKPFAKVEAIDATALRCGGGASGILVSSTARDAGIGGLEFLRSIPGTVGGFVRMNGGAYGREVKDILVVCDVVLRWGSAALSRSKRLGTHIDIANCLRVRSSSAQPSAAMQAIRTTSRLRWIGSPARAKKASRYAAKPAARLSKTPRVTRPGG